jgi:transposase
LSEIFVGIDVSKGHSSAQGLTIEGERAFYCEFKMDLDGFSELMNEIATHSDNVDKVSVAMESTGCYHINLLSFLISKGISCYVINPLLIANFAKLSLRKTKTDKKDAMTIARFLFTHRDSLSRFAESQDSQDMRDIARERESLTFVISNMKNDIKRLLQTTFPELESLSKVFTETMLKFLQKYPSARLVRGAKPQAIAKALIHKKDKRKRILVSAEEIISAAENSVASGSVAKEMILSEKIATVLYLQDKRDKLTEILVEMCQSTMVNDLEILKSIGGIGDVTGTVFLAEMGDIRNFRSYKNVIAFAGLDPSTYQSGQYEGRSKISKRGNRHLRRIIFLMARCVVRSDNVFRAYFLKRKAEGLPPMKALLATAHKLVRVIFAMLTSKSFYREGVVKE